MTAFRFPWRLAPLLLLGLVLACGERESGEPPAADVAAGGTVEMYVTGPRAERRLPETDARFARLLGELERVFAEAERREEMISRSLFRRARDNGALEVRFGDAQRFAVADGDTLSVWRVLIPFGLDVNPAADGSCLFTGRPGWDTTPWFSTRDRAHLLAIVENRAP